MIRNGYVFPVTVCAEITACVPMMHDFSQMMILCHMFSLDAFQSNYHERWCYRRWRNFLQSRFIVKNAR